MSCYAKESQETVVYAIDYYDDGLFVSVYSVTVDKAVSNNINPLFETTESASEVLITLGYQQYNKSPRWFYHVENVNTLVTKIKDKQKIHLSNYSVYRIVISLFDDNLPYTYQGISQEDGSVILQVRKRREKRSSLENSKLCRSHYTDIARDLKTFITKETGIKISMPNTFKGIVSLFKFVNIDKELLLTSVNDYLQGYQDNGTKLYQQFVQKLDAELNKST